MMSFQSGNIYKSNRLSSRRRALGVAALFLLIILILVLYRGGLSSILRKIGYGPWVASEVVSSEVGNISEQLLRSKSAIIVENNELQERLAGYSALQLENKLLTEENKQLREKLGSTASIENHVLALILSRPPVSKYDTLVVDVGAKDGIIVDDEVVSGRTSLGKVISVDEKYSLITLHSSPNQELAVNIGSSTIQATAYGRGDGNFYMRIPAGTDVTEGDIISLSAYPTHVLGSVARVEEASEDSFKLVYFRSPINIHELKWVDIKKQ